MKALVYGGPGIREWKDVPDAKIEAPTDAIVRVDTTTICGTDLHILKGDVAYIPAGRILGHEAVGTIVAQGDAVTETQVGDRVLVSCVNGCGRCKYCKQGRYGACLNGGGWILGHTVDGTQAELVRVQFADMSLYKVPEELDNESVIMLADALPTGYEIGVLNGRTQPGDVVVVIGAGPVGMSAIQTAQLHSPAHTIAVDFDEGRLEAARRLGADLTIKPNEDVRALVDSVTDGLGADVVIEAVGIPATLQQACTLVRNGGHIANVGVHGSPVELPMQDLWIHDITLTTGLIDGYTTADLLKMVQAGVLESKSLITHRFTLDQMMEAYDVFGNAAETKCLKAVLHRA